MHGSTTKNGWRPATVAEVERLLGAKIPEETAAGLGITISEFSAWTMRMRAIIQSRPDALACIQHLSDLRATGGRSYPQVDDADIARRELALARAAAVARSMSIWPGALDPPPYTPTLDGARNAYNSGGWVDGERVPGRRGPHRRREVEHAVFDESPEDDDDERRPPGGGEVNRMAARHNGTEATNPRLAEVQKCRCRGHQRKGLHGHPFEEVAAQRR
jgi:hypothetical protein